jgi:hypothetical protein
MNIRRRFGNFFATVGFVLIVLFFISDYVQQVEAWYLLIGAIMLGVGITLSLRGREDPGPSGRFRLFQGGGRNKRRIGLGIGNGDNDEKDRDDY